MNSHGHAGSSNWRMPQIEELQNLNADMKIVAGDPRLESFWFSGPFWQLQPGFYWSCERDAGTANNHAPCDLPSHPGFSPGSKPVVMEYSFNFADGFLGTDQFDKRFYVMVYFPAGVGPLTQAGSTIRCLTAALPTPTLATVCEVVIGGRVYRVAGSSYPELVRIRRLHFP